MAMSKQWVTELTRAECHEVEAALVARGYPPPPEGYPAEYLLSRLVRAGRLTMDDINGILAEAQK